ncbi:MAG: helix-turn-helix transcriptional regulator [Verrucomicrobia bacterium]|nr:helix-turn-helix transcriptional regulator [Verrucomicrobiota bacterium]
MPGRVSPKTETKNIFGPQLKKLRLAKKMTATEVIAQLGVLGWDVGHSTYSSLEAGDRIIAATELALILKVLKAGLGELRLPRKFVDP